MKSVMYKICIYGQTYFVAAHCITRFGPVNVAILIDMHDTIRADIKSVTTLQRCRLNWDRYSLS